MEDALQTKWMIRAALVLNFLIITGAALGVGRCYDLMTNGGWMGIVSLTGVMIGGKVAERVKELHGQTEVQKTQIVAQAAASEKAAAQV